MAKDQNDISFKVIGRITKKLQNFSKMINWSQNQRFRNFTKYFLMFEPFVGRLNFKKVNVSEIFFLNIWFWEKFTILEKFCDFFVMRPITINDISF